MPPIGLMTGGVDFSELYVNLSGGDYQSLAQASEAGAATINIGVFINSVISFAIVAIVLFLVVNAMNQLRRKQEEEPASEPPSSREVQLPRRVGRARLEKRFPISDRTAGNDAKESRKTKTNT